MNTTNRGQVSSDCVNAAILLGKEIGKRIDASKVSQLPSIAAVARHLNVSKTNFYNFARRRGGMRATRKCDRVSDEQDQQIKDLLTDSSLTQKEVAELVGVSYRTVKMRKHRLDRQEMIVASSEAEFKEEQHHCRLHGLVIYTPCPACAAMRAAIENRERVLMAKAARQRMEERR